MSPNDAILRAALPRERARVPRELTVAVAVASGVFGAENALLLAAQVRERGTVEGTYAAFEAGVRVGNLTGLRLALMLATGVLFLLWLRQMRINAEILRPGGHRMSRGWIVGAWFIPVAWFFLPKRIINDIWAASCPADRVRRTSVLLTSWWLTFIASRMAGTFGPARSALSIAAAVLAIAVVLKLTQMQRERLAEL